MNWYIYSKRDFYEKDLFSSPPTKDDLSGISAAWLSPYNILYPMEENQYTHIDWVDYYRDYLDRMYNMPFLKPLKHGSHDIWYKMIDEGWIRFRFAYPMWIITLSDINDEKQLKRIENILFKSISKDDVVISISEPMKQGMKFNWQDFLKSGLSFVDFIQEQKQI
jgi:hypothetical protein